MDGKLDTQTVEEKVMKWQIWLPLALASVLYVAQATAYFVVAERPGLALCFIGYTLANIGLIYDAYQWGLR